MIIFVVVFVVVVVVVIVMTIIVVLVIVVFNLILKASSWPFDGNIEGGRGTNTQADTQTSELIDST